MKHKITLALVLAGILVVSGCSVTGKDHGREWAKYSTERSQIWNRYGEMAVELDNKVVMATAEYKRFLIFTTKNESYGGATNVIAATHLGGLGNFAAFKAAKDAGADGIYVVRAKQESSGFLGITANVKVTVWGMPFKYKFLGLMDPKRADERRHIEAKSSIFPF